MLGWVESAVPALLQKQAARCFAILSGEGMRVTNLNNKLMHK